MSRLPQTTLLLLLRRHALSASPTSTRAYHNNRRTTNVMPAGVPSTSQVHAGAAVSIVLKADQHSGRQVQGTVQDVLTRGNHPRGIKVRLVDGRIGRVQGMMGSASSSGSAFTSGSGSGSGSASGSGYTPFPFTSASTASSAPGAPGAPGAEASRNSTSEEIRRDLAIQQRTRGPSSSSSTSDRPSRGGAFQHKYADVRFDEAAEQPPESLDLMAFVKQPRQQKNNNKKGNAKASASSFSSDGQAKPYQQQQHSELVRALDVVHAETVKCPVCGSFEGDEAAVAHHVEGHFT